MFHLFQRKPLLQEEINLWLLDTFAWCLENFDADLFFRETRLVIPDNRMFPGRADSFDGMANLVFDRVKEYAGIAHWPTRVVDQSLCALDNQARVEIQGALRGPGGQVNNAVAEEHRLLVPYNPQQVNNPEAMIATFAHIVAHHLGQMAKAPPPGGTDHWPHATEVLAVYLGFGLMFANSAFTFRGGCGSCYNPLANRNAYLSELETVYTLAIFAVLKDLPPSQVTPHLKRHLRGSFKQMCRDLHTRTDQLARFQKLRPLAGGAGA